MHDDRAHLAAILTRAAILEAARQRASKAGDVTVEAAALRELEALRRAYHAAIGSSRSAVARPTY